MKKYDINNACINMVKNTIILQKLCFSYPFLSYLWKIFFVNNYSFRNSIVYAILYTKPNTSLEIIST